MVGCFLHFQSAVKKALIQGAFFIACFNLQPAAANTACPEFIDSKSARIAYIHDGDTVHLSDKRKVRLIGIDTPELARRRGKQQLPEQAFASIARDFARQLLKQQGSKVKLMPGIEAKDKYGRHLFHIQLADGSLLQTRLIEAGLAVAFTTPPNQRFSQCYLQTEQQARQLQQGFWTDPKYQVIESTQLTASHSGFGRVRGRVSHIGESKKAWWINFGQHFAARIHKSDLQYFNQPLQHLIGKRVIIKGWLRRYKDKHQMSLRHASAIEILSTN